MTLASEKLSVLVFDKHRDKFPEFYTMLGMVAHLHMASQIKGILHSQCFPSKKCVVLLDLGSLDDSDPMVEKIVELKGRSHVGLLADSQSGDYLDAIRRWGILHVLVKDPPVDKDELLFFLRCLEDPANGFGLGQYLTQTIEMYRIQVSKKEEKLGVIERIINHFATAGYEIHELYDVRLILEETLNNSIFHGFKTATGERKYHPDHFVGLEKGEKILVEYGSNGHMAGFTVTDNAGTLNVATVLQKLEKQLDPTGVFTFGGRGLHLSRLLSTWHIINLEVGERTQIIALFDARRRLDRIKPFMFNVIGDDEVSDWQTPFDLD